MESLNIDKILEHIDVNKAKRITEEFERNFNLPEDMKQLFCPVCENVLKTRTEGRIGVHFDSNNLRCFRKISRGIEYEGED